MFLYLVQVTIGRFLLNFTDTLWLTLSQCVGRKDITIVVFKRIMSKLMFQKQTKQPNLCQE
mgnify:CR=1 FL=1